MSSEPLDHSNEPEIDEVEAALSNLEGTLEGGLTDRILVNIFFFFDGATLGWMLTVILRFPGLLQQNTCFF